MYRKIVTIAAALLFVLCPSWLAMAAGADLSLSAGSAAAGDAVTVSGTAAPGALVPVKVVDGDGHIVFYAEAAADAGGGYSCSFAMPEVNPGALTVVAGSGSDVASGTLTATQSGGGGHSSGGSGGSSSPGAVHDTTGKAYVYPSAGGTVSLGGRAGVVIPAGALQGSSAVRVAVQEVDSPPAAPAGFMVQGTAYRLTVDGQDHYNFNRPVTLTFTFDPSSLAPGEEPAVFYYDEGSGQWVNIGGAVSGSTITVTVDHFTQYAVMTAQESLPAPEEKLSVTLKDISGHWAEANIKKLVALGAISGYPDGTFIPDSTITRAEFAAVLVKAFHLEAKGGKVFSDTANHWAKDFIAAVASLGIVSGYPDGNFGPDEFITREQMAVMTVKAAGLAGTAPELTFTDTRDISDWALEAVAVSTDSGIMKGYPDNTVRPGGSATRAEAVTVILNALSSK